MPSNRRRLSLEVLEPRTVLSSGGVSAMATVSVSIPDDLTAAPGSQVVAPVNIDNAAGIRGANIAINYDSTLIHTSNTEVLVGSVWPEGTLVEVNVNDSAGTILVSLSSETALGTGSGSLITVNFAISSSATVGNSTTVDLVSVELNEGDPSATLTDGLITFVAPSNTAKISGIVYADTSGNSQPDQAEGIPGVQVILVNAGNGQQTATYTDDYGRYQFNSLAAGSYRILEQQPRAFLDGGSNEISVSLTSGQDLTNQNFRERGLQPEYIYNRLFTTTALPVSSANWISTIRTIVATAGSIATTSQSITTTNQGVAAPTTTQNVPQSTPVATPKAIPVVTSQPTVAPLQQPRPQPVPLAAMTLAPATPSPSTMAIPTAAVPEAAPIAIGDSMTATVTSQATVASEFPLATAADGMSGLIASASVSGVVYADGNANSQPDECEAIAGVEVVLVAPDGSRPRTAITDDNGQYQFDKLTAGSYRLQLQHLAGLLNDELREIPLALAVGQNVTNQDLRLEDLRPEYVQNQLFTTESLPVGSTDWSSAAPQTESEAESRAMDNEAEALITSLATPSDQLASVDSVFENLRSALFDS